MTEDDAHRLMQDYLDALVSRGNYAPFFAEDVLWTTMDTGEEVRGRDAVAGYIRAFHTEMFDAGPELKRSAVTGDGAFVEADFVGRHTGMFGDLPPTGAHVRVPYVVAYDLADGKIAALRFYMSMSAVLKQLQPSVPSQAGTASSAAV